MATHRVLVTHEGETNPKIAGIGALVTLAGILFLKASSGFGAMLLLVGIGMVVYGLKKRTKACPDCRTQISPRAAVCPQCHSTLQTPAITA